MCEVGGGLADTELIQVLTLGVAPYTDPKYSANFRANAFFIGNSVRDSVNQAQADYTPIFLSQVPGLFRSRRVPIEVALITVSPPDEHGFCSLGVSVDITKSAVESAKVVIAQVNAHMPRALGNCFIHVSRINWLVEHDEPLLEWPVMETMDEVTQRIADNVSRLIHDGATLQLGIGRIPDAILATLTDRHDLGIHTEMFSDGVMKLALNGNITGRCKTQHTGKIVGSFAAGSRELFEFMDNNPMIEMHPSEYTNDPFVISRQDNMVAINSALEVDLTGQVCADSLGQQFFSGIGGHADFMRGTALARNGIPIIAMPSTASTPSGLCSRIVPVLSDGAGVVTTRGDVHYVVTEYGVAYLHGNSVQERAMALITIAHPDFREELLAKAIEYKWVRPEMADVEGRFFVGPKEVRTTMLLDDGTLIGFRAMNPTDEPATRDLFYSLSQETVYYRYMSHMKRIPRKQLQNFVYVDHRNEVAIVGTVPEAHGEEIIAIGRYYLDQKTNRAEVAFVVRDDWQRQGIGSFIMKHLANIAKRNGIAGFTAEVMRDNKAMQAVINHSGMKVKSTLNDGVHHFEMDF